MDIKAQKKFFKDDILVFFSKNRPLLLVLVFSTLLIIFTNIFLTQNNLMSLARQISANVIIGIDYTLLLASDSVDLSAGYMMHMTGIVSGLLSQTGLSFPVILILCILVGVAYGAWNATIESKSKLPPFLMTLAMQQVFRGRLMLLSNGSPIGDLSKGILSMRQDYIGPTPTPVVLMLSFIVVGALIFSRAQLGCNVIAMDGDPEATRMSGIDVGRTRVLVNMVLGTTIAVTALVSCGCMASAQTTLGGDTVMDIIAAVVIGGTPMGGDSGTVVGTFFGCLVIGLISNGLSLFRVSSYWQMVSEGVIILVAVILDVYSEKVCECTGNKEWWEK